jgi:hypothetical protein
MRLPSRQGKRNFESPGITPFNWGAIRTHAGRHGAARLFLTSRTVARPVTSGVVPSVGKMVKMNKSALKNNAWTQVRIRPVAKRFFGAEGPQLPPVDDTWVLEGVDDSGVRIRNTVTQHRPLLGFDQVHHYATDLGRGAGNGFLILNTQLHIGGSALWTEPTFRPGEALPDRFGSVRNWDRRNDNAYVQSLFPNTQPTPVVTHNANSNPAAQFGLVACLCIGVGLLIANA